MVSLEKVTEWALALPGTDMQPHFEKNAFRLMKKIYATLDPKHCRLMVKLPQAVQSVYCQLDREVIYPVPGAWGVKGATYIELRKVNAKIVKEVLHIAYEVQSAQLPKRKTAAKKVKKK